MKPWLASATAVAAGFIVSARLDRCGRGDARLRHIPGHAGKKTVTAPPRPRAKGSDGSPPSKSTLSFFAADSWKVKGKQRIVGRGGCGAGLIREVLRLNTDLPT